MPQTKSDESCNAMQPKGLLGSNNQSINTTDKEWLLTRGTIQQVLHKLQQ